jgi:hypothetical protein
MLFREIIPNLFYNCDVHVCDEDINIKDDFCFLGI